jgi:hypothetical protein
VKFAPRDTAQGRSELRTEHRKVGASNIDIWPHNLLDIYNEFYKPRAVMASHWSWSCKGKATKYSDRIASNFVS